jgi:gas vesicle protein
MLKIIGSKEASQIAVVPSKMNGDNLNNVRYVTSTHFRNKKKEYLKDKLNELTDKIIIEIYRGIHDFKRGYQPRSNLVKDEIGDLLADSHNTTNRWKNFFSQLLDVHSH